MNVLSLFDGMSCGQLSLEMAGKNIHKYYAAEIDKHAIEVAKDNYPNTIHLGSVIGLKASNLDKIDLLIGGSPCFTKSNFVLTNKGYVFINELKVGMKVLTHKNRYKKILAIGSDIKETCIVKSQGAIDITTTTNHPFYISEKNKNVYNNPIWKEVQNFDKTDKVISIKNKSKINQKFSDIDLYILGRFLADGYVFKTKRKHGKNSYMYKFVITCKKDEIDDFKSKVDDRFSYIEERTVYKAFIYQKEWVKLGEKFGKHAQYKFIPNFILDLPKDKLKIFIDGYLDGNGTKLDDNTIRGTTVSKKLALTLALAIQKVYYEVSINKIKTKDYTVIEGRKVNQRDYYNINFKLNQNKLVKYKNIDKNYIAYNQKVIKTNKIEKVYNIEVEDDNSYIVNNIIVHNCQSFSRNGDGSGFNGKSKLFWEYVRLLKEIQENNPNVSFLLENVIMKKEWEVIITEALGVEPIMIDSTLVSAQKRQRLYWTNIPNVIQPNDLGITLLDIIDGDREIINNHEVVIKKDGNSFHVKNATKSGFLIANEGDSVNLELPKSLTRRGRVGIGKTNTLNTSCNYAMVYKGNLVKLNIRDFERLQTLPDDYTKVASNNQRKKMIGNGWTARVISYILSFLP